MPPITKQSLAKQAAAAPAPAPKAPAPATAKAPAPVTPKAPTKPSPATSAPVSGAAAADPRVRDIVARDIFDSSKARPAAVEPKSAESRPPVGGTDRDQLYKDKLAQTQARREAGQIGEYVQPLSRGGMSMIPLFMQLLTRPPARGVAQPYQYRSNPKGREGESLDVTMARPRPEAYQVEPADFARQADELGAQYAKLSQAKLDLDRARAEHEATLAAARDRGEASPDAAAALKDVARKTRAVNQDMAQTLADLNEFSITPQEAEEIYGGQ